MVKCCIKWKRRLLDAGRRDVLFAAARATGWLKGGGVGALVGPTWLILNTHALPLALTLLLRTIPPWHACSFSYTHSLTPTLTVLFCPLPQVYELPEVPSASSSSSGSGARTMPLLLSTDSCSLHKLNARLAPSSSRFIDTLPPGLLGLSIKSSKDAVHTQSACC